MRDENRFLKRHKSGVWYYRRRVPLNVRDLDKRFSIETSLKTISRGLAERVFQRG